MYVNDFFIIKRAKRLCHLRSPINSWLPRAEAAQCAQRNQYRHGIYTLFLLTTQKLNIPKAGLLLLGVLW